MTKKMDPKEVASKQSHESEVKYIAKTYKIPIAVVRSVIKKLKEEGKGFRSRKVIYDRLRDLEYVIETKK